MSWVGSRNRFLSLFVFLIASLGLTGVAFSQDAKSSKKSTDNAAAADQANQEVDPLKKPVDAKKKKQQVKDYRKELKGAFKKRLEEDVAWIITDEERAAFRQLSNDEERDN